MRQQLWCNFINLPKATGSDNAHLRVGVVVDHHICHQHHKSDRESWIWQAKNKHLSIKGHTAALTLAASAGPSIYIRIHRKQVLFTPHYHPAIRWSHQSPHVPFLDWPTLFATLWRNPRGTHVSHAEEQLEKPRMLRKRGHARTRSCGWVT